MYTLSLWAASNSGWWKCFRSQFGQCTGCCWCVLWRVSQWHSAQVIKRTHCKRSSWLWLDICGIGEAFEVPRPTVRSRPTSRMSHYPVQLKYPTHMYARVSHNDQHKQWPCFIANMHTKKNPIKGQCYWPVGIPVRKSEWKEKAGDSAKSDFGVWRYFCIKVQGVRNNTACWSNIPNMWNRGPSAHYFIWEVVASSQSHCRRPLSEYHSPPSKGATWMDLGCTLMLFE